MTPFLTRTVGDVISEILMSRAAFAGSFLVLEGESDVKFWRPRVVDQAQCQIILACGKATVVGVVAKTEGLGEHGILGVIDDDCDSLRGQGIESENLVRTATRDIETLMLRSEALDRVLVEIGDPAKIGVLEEQENRSIREALVARSLIFGQLRYLNALHDWRIDFESLSPWRFADHALWQFDRAALLEEVSKLLGGVPVGDIEGYIANIGAGDVWTILHGKDSLSILAIGIRNRIGSQQHPVERMGQMLRLAFDGALLEDTTVFEDIRRWEARNPPYRVLR